MSLEMPLYQKSVLNKYLKQLDTPKVDKAYKKYANHFLNLTIQDNIRNSKEEEYQGIFLTDLFVNILDYSLKPSPNFNLVAEFKNQTNSRKADGAILIDNKAIGVIELKGTNTKDLESIRKQAFDYKANQKECVYVITSNYEKLRFYINDATEFEEFNLFDLSRDQFELLYLCLNKEHITNNIPLKIKEDSLLVEEQITKKFYKDYSFFKRELYRDLVKRNTKRIKLNLSKISSETNEADLDEETKVELFKLEKNVKLNLFKKSQKLIDRFLFVFFAEDRGLLPPNSTLQILNKWKADVEFGDDRPLYDMFKQYFKFLDTGRQGTTNRAEIYAYNGGLFKEDRILDDLEIDNELLYNHTKILASYNFESQVDVNILGHIFENSLNEIESVNAEIEGGDFDKQKSKRKKDGVFYTPKYITKYIVENTVGKLCEEKKTELGFKEEEYFKGRKNRQQATIIKLVEILNTYREWLLQLTICDPACGSGAFLNQALDFLIKEHNYIDELKTKILGGGLVFSDIENTILENNIYGVDLNEESVEIAKLSLWLRTAQPRRKLNNLNSNIKCGNSLIDSKAVAGDKAFNWQEQFPHVFAQGGFDVIIGNPPYGDFFNESEKSYLLKKYSTSFSGTFDMYILFFEASLKILKSKRKLCFITPNTFIEYSQFSGLRKLLTSGNNIEQILGLTKVFIDAIVDTAIIILTKNTAQSEYFKGKIFKEKLNSIELIEIPNLKSENLNINGFTLKFSENFNVRDLIKKNPMKLSDIIKITQGITTGGNESFIAPREFFLKKNIPETVIKKVLKGKTINRYSLDFDDEYILYSVKSVNQESQIRISNLLEPFREKLSSKRETKQGKLPWYCLHWARNEMDFNKPKILIRQTASSILGMLDTDSYYPIDSIHTLNLKKDEADEVRQLKYILGLLNSKLFKYLYSWKLDEAGTVYPQVKKVNIEWLPIVNFNDSEKVSVKTEEIQTLKQEKNRIRRNFIKYLGAKYSQLDNYSSIENWHELSFADFIKEINKAIKTINKERIKNEQQPIKQLTKLDEMDWMDVFGTKKAEAQALKQQIDSTDKEIDSMVYELYGLSEEEIAIVENS